MSEIKIILTSTCGTYSSWLAWTVASCYNIVNDVVVVNGGYNIHDPELGNANVLERERDQLKELDIDKKIVQVKPNNDKLNSTGLFKKGKDETARSGNMTLSYQYALALAKKKGYDLNKVWILKLDSDQIADEYFNRNTLEGIATHGDHVGYRFAQYSDFFRTYDRVQSLCGWVDEKKKDFTNDGALFFKAHSQAHAGGQGSPGVGEEYPMNYLKTFHMRRIHPPDVDEYDYHFKRFWYHTWGPNEINEHDYNRRTGKKLTLEEINELAHRDTKSLMNSTGHTADYFDNDMRFPPKKPVVVNMGYAEYIKEGLPY